MPKELVGLGKQYLTAIEKKMKASGAASDKLKYKPKSIKKKKLTLIKHKLKRMTKK